MAKNKVKLGRPTVMTPEVIRKIEEVAALDGTVEEMAYYAGIHRDTIYAKLQDDKDFSDRINALRERPILKARQTIVKALDDPNYAFKYVERKRRKEFGANVDLTTDGKEFQPFTNEQLALIFTRRNTSSDTSSEGKSN